WPPKAQKRPPVHQEKPWQVAKYLQLSLRELAEFNKPAVAQKQCPKVLARRGLAWVVSKSSLVPVDGSLPVLRHEVKLTDRRLDKCVQLGVSPQRWSSTSYL